MINILSKNMLILPIKSKKSTFKSEFLLDLSKKIKILTKENVIYNK